MYPSVLTVIAEREVAGRQEPARFTDHARPAARTDGSRTGIRVRAGRSLVRLGLRLVGEGEAGVAISRSSVATAP